MNRYFNIAIYLSMTIVMIDQVSKWWILRNLALDHGMRINNYLNLIHVHNTGMTFGILNHYDPHITLYLLTGSALLILFFLGRWLWRTPSGIVAMALALVMGGAIGNVIDRIRFGAVIDFLDFHWEDHHWYTFNVADSAIVTGVGVLLLDSMLRKR